MQRWKAAIWVWLALALAVSAAMAQEPLNFAVIGDSGETGKAQQKVAGQMMSYYDQQRRFDFVLMLGDNVYPDGVGRGLKFHFEVPFAALLGSGVKFYAALGNHDIRRGADLQIG